LPGSVWCASSGCVVVQRWPFSIIWHWWPALASTSLRKRACAARVGLPCQMTGPRGVVADLAALPRSGGERTWDAEGHECRRLAVIDTTDQSDADGVAHDFRAAAR
jgi:hypothetical protein